MYDLSTLSQETLCEIAAWEDPGNSMLEPVPGRCEQCGTPTLAFEMVLDTAEQRRSMVSLVGSAMARQPADAFLSTGTPQSQMDALVYALEGGDGTLCPTCGHANCPSRMMPPYIAQLEARLRSRGT